MRVSRYYDQRPWGFFEGFTPTAKPSRFESIKIITVFPDSELSLQLHNKRDEFFKILQGSGKVRIGERTYDAKEGDEFFINKKELHQVTTSSETIKILEISFDEFDESDIVRLSDRYGRV